LCTVPCNFASIAADDVAGNPDDEKLAEAGIEDELAGWRKRRHFG
jgi:hypothetical protein